MKTFFNAHRYLFITFSGLLLSTAACQPSCTQKGETEETVKNSEAAVAVVNGVELKQSELDALHKRSVEKFAKAGRPLTTDLDRKMRASILRKMIDDEIIRQKVEAEGVKVERFERVAAFEKYKERLGGPKVYDLFLEREQLTQEQVEKTVLTELQRNKLIEKLGDLQKPTEEEIKKHYEANQKLYSLPEMVHARHILLKLDKNEPQEKAALVQKKAQDILKEALEPGASFEALVQKYSEGPSVKAGGDLGFFPRGRMVKEFEEVAFNAPFKRAVGPVRTDFGYHIIYVEEKSPPKPAPLDQVRDRVVEFLTRHKQGRKNEELLSALRQSAKVKVYDYSMTQEEYKDLAERNQLAAHDDK